MVSQPLGDDRCGRRTRTAFTLIELLVVIAIIALLIAILLPSLEAARRQSKQSACLSHIKNIATSSRVYEADDPNGWGIPVHPLQYRQCPNQHEGEMCNEPILIGAYEWGGKSGIGQDDFVTGSPGDPINSKYGTLAGFGPSTRPMNDILYAGGFKDNAHPVFDRFGATLDTELELDLFQCPADDGPPRGAHCADWIRHSERSSFDHFGNSYCANVFMIANGGGGVMRTNSPYLRPTSRVPTPARTLFFEENIGRWAWSCWREQCDFITGIDPGPTRVVHGWHGKDWTFNRAFVDAHAEPQKIYFEGTEDASGYALHYRCEDGVFENQSCQSHGYRCVIVRGDGWQKDTLPAPDIPTGLYWSGQWGRPSYEACVQAGSPE
ncbi:MAG: prepilin-type N-terminal cleavage/methylation domain-containing protein [Phycisphaerales bacterium]|nr:MAG: prepilin-type N-terminal cleavage/methylation domain-containing protein [Phycisphaerales bacterium]